MFSYAFKQTSSREHLNAFKKFFYARGLFCWEYSAVKRAAVTNEPPFEIEESHYVMKVPFPSRNVSAGWPKLFFLRFLLIKINIFWSAILGLVRSAGKVCNEYPGRGKYFANETAFELSEWKCLNRGIFWKRGWSQGK